MSLVDLVLRILGRKREGAGGGAPADRASGSPPTRRRREDAFEAALEFTLRHEGGYVNDPDDPGGRTNFGVSERANPEAWADGKVTLDEARAIYRRRYWDAIRGDELPVRTAIATFDFTVHSGEGVAGRALQQLVGAKPDGDIGSGTAEAARKAAPDDAADLDLAFRLNVARALHAGRWIAAQPGARGKFAPGFLRRLVELDALLARF